MKKITSLIAASIVFSFVISNCYAIELKVDALNDENSMVPKSYATVIKGKKGEGVAIGNSNTTYGPSDLNHILEAYGVTLTPEALMAENSMVPKSYATVIKGQKGEVVAIGNSNTTYGPSDLNHILAAYKLPEMVVIEVAVVEPVVAAVEVDCVDSDGDTVCDEIDVCGASPKGVKVDERGCWTLEQSYFFDFDKSEVKSESLPLLDHIAKIMNDNPKMKVQIEGHTDSKGSVEYNQGLSERRANAIKSALVKRTMVDAGRLNAVGFGESKPITTNDTEAGRAKNRRVDLKPIW
jgi:outer membrane protein OmpA-like peptidoglycan-associated protein